MKAIDLTPLDILECQNNNSFYVLKDENLKILKIIAIDFCDDYLELINCNKTGIQYLEDSTICFEISRITKKYRNKSYYIEVYNDITKVNKIHNKDKLTGLYNRRRIDQEIKLAINEDSIIIMGDLDSFKNINDAYGHLIGDDVLHHTSAILKKHISRGNFVGRYGGDEFIIILHKTTIKDAYRFIETIRKDISNTPFIFIDADNKKIKIPIKVTFGMCEYKKDNDIIKTISQADQALYYAKTHGKNSTHIYNNKEDLQ